MEIAKYQRAVNQRQDVAEVAKGMLQFYEENTAYPASLNDLANSDGYEQVRTIIERQPNMVYSTVNITGAEYQYQRFIVYIPDHYDTKDQVAFLNNNECGATSFNQDGDYCPDSTSNYYLGSNLNHILTARKKAVYQLDQTMARLVLWGGHDLPGNALADGTRGDLAGYAGFTGTAAACNGVYVFDGAALGCSDLYNNWGIPVVFNKVSSTHIALSTRLPFLDSAGNSLLVGRDIQL